MPAIFIDFLNIGKKLFVTFIYLLFHCAWCMGEEKELLILYLQPKRSQLGKECKLGQSLDVHYDQKDQ